MAADEKDEKESEQKSSPLKLILIIVVALGLLGGGGFFAYSKFFAKHGGEGEGSHAAVEAAPVIQELDTFLVNLSDPGGKRYLKLTMRLKLSGPPVAQEFTNRNFELRDMILMILSAKEFADIASPEDKAALKQEILAQLNQSLKQGQVQDIYFTEFLVQ